MKLVWKFLKDREGWTFRAGRGLEPSFLYYQTDRPTVTFPNQGEVRESTDCFMFALRRAHEVRCTKVCLLWIYLYALRFGGLGVVGAAVSTGRLVSGRCER